MSATAPLRRYARPSEPAAPILQPGRSPQPARLWLHLHLPRLALEAICAASEQPTAIIEGTGKSRQVVACNPAAQRRGVLVGMPAAAAQAQVCTLRLVERQPAQERLALECLAARVQRYTSVVSVEQSGLALEVGGSLHLFGGLEAIRTAVLEDVRALGYTAQSAAAPTPLAARWLALAGETAALLDASTLPGRLGVLPLHSLDWPTETVRKLARMGVRTVRDVLRLPRDGLARRLGPQLTVLLDRALGRLPDPRDPFRTPRRFRATLELPAEAERADEILPALTLLLDELEDFLISHASGIRSLEATLHHRQTQPTRVPLTLRRAARDAAEFADLFAHLLESLALPVPVTQITLRSEALQPWHADTAGLLEEESRHSDADLDSLVERLQARLGRDAVYGVAAVGDHRPERAWRRTEPLHARSRPGPAYDRPLWLLPQPIPLGRGDRPAGCELQSGPERIESGWWDGAGIARDYYRACNAGGQRVWVFRTLPRNAALPSAALADLSDAGRADSHAHSGSHVNRDTAYPLERAAGAAPPAHSGSSVNYASPAIPHAHSGAGSDTTSVESVAAPDPRYESLHLARHLKQIPAAHDPRHESRRHSIAPTTAAHSTSPSQRESVEPEWFLHGLFA